MAKKGFKKVKKSEKVESKVEYPVEVLLYDCIAKQRIVAEYRGESKWWYGTRIYKAYHPSFAEVGYRWVTKLGRILGSFDPKAPSPTLGQIADEKAMIKHLMS